MPFFLRLQSIYWVPLISLSSAKYTYPIIPSSMDQLDLDLESASRTALSLQIVKLNVVVRKGQYTGSLYIFEYTSADSAERVLQKLRLYFNQHMSTPWTRFWLYSLLCTRLAIETVTLASVD
ncbi:MAG: hypothetical protein M1830_000949, partial [Pleopsidium flavum]